MHRFFFLKEATEEPSSKTGKADRLCFSQLFRAGVQRDAIPLCWGQGVSPCWGQRATPIGRLRAAAIIGSRVKRLAQEELMPCVNSYWVLPDA